MAICAMQNILPRTTLSFHSAMISPQLQCNLSAELSFISFNALTVICDAKRRSVLEISISTMISSLMRCAGESSVETDLFGEWRNVCLFRMLDIRHSNRCIWSLSLDSSHGPRRLLQTTERPYVAGIILLTSRVWIRVAS